MSPHATLNDRRRARPVQAVPTPKNGAAQASVSSRELIIGTLLDAPGGESALIEFGTGEGSRRCHALTTVPLSAEDVGRSVALAFVASDPGRPVVLGLIAAGSAHRSERRELESSGKHAPQNPEETLLIAAEREIVLRCGKASLTLTRSGKILIRGAYLLSRSSGVNRIKGGSVQIN